ncbi:MAG: hypothetical protein KKI08_22835 [Armatimonadetes bacterium]|nr:hypothetical protein [Armatimonadota bacterium]
MKARIRLLRSFDQIHHFYLGYVLVLDGTLDGMPVEALRIAVGPKAHEKHQFHIGDQITGKAVAVSEPETEWAGWYKVSELRLLSRGPADQDVPPNPEGGIAPPLPDYRERGHRRLEKSTYEAHCQCCPFGLVMATQIIIDQWNPSHVRWRYETHCYGPRDCPRYRPGKPYRVQGRQPGMVWVDDDVEREEQERRDRL